MALEWVPFQQSTGELISWWSNMWGRNVGECKPRVVSSNVSGGVIEDRQLWDTDTKPTRIKWLPNEPFDDTLVYRKADMFDGSKAKGFVFFSPALKCEVEMSINEFVEHVKQMEKGEIKGKWHFVKRGGAIKIERA